MSVGKIKDNPHHVPGTRQALGGAASRQHHLCPRLPAEGGNGVLETENQSEYQRTNFQDRNNLLQYTLPKCNLADNCKLKEGVNTN